MKLNKEESKKNIIIKDLENVQERLTEVRVSNGKLCVSSIALLTATFGIMLNTVFNCMDKSSLDIKNMLVNIVLLGICGGISMRLLSMIDKKQKESASLENDKLILLDELKNMIESNEQVKEKTKKLK